MGVPKKYLQFKRLALPGMRTRKRNRLNTALAQGSITGEEHQRGLRLLQEEFDERMAVVDTEEVQIAAGQVRYWLMV